MFFNYKTAEYRCIPASSQSFKPSISQKLNDLLDTYLNSIINKKNKSESINKKPTNSNDQISPKAVALN